MFLNEQKKTMYCSECKTLMFLNVASRAAERRGQQGEGQLALVSNLLRGPKFKKWPKIEQGAIKVGASVSHYRYYISTL